MTSSDQKHNMDLSLFGKRLEEILKACLKRAGIPFHHVEYHPTSEGKTAIEVVAFFTLDLKTIEETLLGIFTIDNEQSVSVSERIRRGEQLPGTYLARLNGTRASLPEWSAFADEPVLILVSSLFQGALFSLLGFFSGEDLPESRDLEKEIDCFSAMVAQLDAGFADLYRASRQDPEKRLPAEDDKNSLTRTEKEKPPRPAPAGNAPSEEDAEDPLDAASLRLFMTAGKTITGMWVDVATEGGIRVLAPEESGEDDGGLTRLFDFLQSHDEVNGYETMERYFQDRLGTWEKIYEALELALSQGTLQSTEIPFYKLVLILLQAREHPLFHTS